MRVLLTFFLFNIATSIFSQNIWDLPHWVIETTNIVSTIEASKDTPCLSANGNGEFILEFSIKFKQPNFVFSSTNFHLHWFDIADSIEHEQQGSIEFEKIDDLTFVFELPIDVSYEEICGEGSGYAEYHIDLDIDPLENGLVEIQHSPIEFDLFLCCQALDIYDGSKRNSKNENLDLSLHSVEIFNLSGQLVYSRNLYLDQITNSSFNLPSGLYILIIKDGNSRKIKKIFI